MSLVDYSDIEQEIAESPEPKIMGAGAEVTARIISVTSGISEKNDATWHNVTYDIPDEPLAKSFKKFFWDLKDKDLLEAKQKAGALHDFQQFAAAFSIDYSRPFSWEDDLPGLTGDTILGVKKDAEYGDQNIIKKFIAPR